MQRIQKDAHSVANGVHLLATEVGDSVGRTFTFYSVYFEV